MPTPPESDLYFSGQPRPRRCSVDRDNPCSRPGLPADQRADPALGATREAARRARRSCVFLRSNTNVDAKVDLGAAGTSASPQAPDGSLRRAAGRLDPPKMCPSLTL